MTLRVVVAGSGPRGLEHASAIQELEGLQLSGIADLSAAARERAESELGVGAHAELGALIADTEPQIVVVATPAFVREELVVPTAAAPSVVGILVEKPLSLQLAAARRMIEACDEQGVLLTVGHHLRYGPHLVAMKEAIDSGEIGAVEFLRGAAFGDLLDQGGHLIDAMRWLTGDRQVLWAMSQRGDQAAGRLPGSAPDGGSTGWIPAWSTHYLAFEGGLRGVLETGPLHQRGRAFVDEWLDKRITAIGTDGVAECTVGGDCRVLAGGSEWKVHPGGLGSSRAALLAFHAALRDAVQGRGSHRADAHRILRSHEATLACAQSMLDGDAVTLPLAPDRDPISELIASPARPRPIAGSPADADDRRNPELSVLLPLADHRGRAPDSVGALTKAQTLERSRFEVIVVSDASEPELEREVEALLGEGDRLIRRPGLDETALYAEAAQEARGELLWLTESHAIAEREALDELIAYMRRTDYDGACCRSIGLNANAFAKQQDAFYDRGFDQWTQPGEWSRVIYRGFAIRKDAYMEAGGLDVGCGRFSEHALAARLHSLGKRLGYAAGCTVRHTNTTNFKLLNEEVADFAAGEIRYRARMPREYCERYFGTPAEWAGRRSLDRASARTAARLSLRGALRARSPRKAASTLSALRGTLGPAVLGPAPRIARTSLAITWARLRRALWLPISPARSQRAYDELYDGIARRARLREVARLAVNATPLEPSTAFEVADLPDDRLFGFYGPELLQGQRFRWSRPVAFFDLPVQPGSYRVDLGTLPHWSGDRERLDVSFNGRTLSPEKGNGELSFSIGEEDFGDGDQRLALVCPGFRPSSRGSSDRRLLGVPLSRIDFTPDAS